MSLNVPVAGAVARDRVRDRIRGFLLTTERHTTQSMRSWTSERHARDELIWSTAGVIRVRTDDAIWTVPAHRAVWVPEGVSHTIEAAADTILHATFVARGAAVHLPREAVVVEMLPTIRELLLLNAECPLDPETRMRVQGLALELLRPAPSAQVDLQMPESPRLRLVAERILDAPHDFRATEHWAERAGLPAREFVRGFVAETGLSFTQWRIRARVRASLLLLGSGTPVVAVAKRLGYANASTFIDHFRVAVGTTPAAYFSGRCAVAALPTASDENRHDRTE